MEYNVNARNDFFGRVQHLIEITDPIWILLGLAGVLFLVTIGLFGRRKELLFLLVAAATFSGAMWASVDIGSTLVRWLILALLALNCLRLRVYPGTPLLLFLIYGVLGVGMIVFSEVLFWSLQTGGVLMLTILAAVALSDVMQTRDDIRKILYLYLMAAMGWLALGMATLPQLLAAKNAARISGVITSAPLFVITGGLLLPVAVWGALCSKRHGWKIFCSGLSIALILLLFVSGQRTGTFGGLIGCLPLVFRRKAGNLVFVLMLIGVVGVTGFRLATMNRQQVDFLKKRYLTTDTNGRTTIWTEAITECLHSPVIGRGHGGDRAFGMKYHHPTHNAYLAAWYNTGLIGVSFYLAAFAVGASQCLKLIRFGRDQDLRDMARVLLGVLMAEFAVGMFETTSSPSNFATITLAMVLAMIGRLSQVVRAERTAPAAQRAVRYVWVPATQLKPAPGLRPST